jgi:hypothetical protein
MKKSSSKRSGVSEQRVKTREYIQTKRHRDGIPETTLFLSVWLKNYTSDKNPSSIFIFINQNTFTNYADERVIEKKRKYK